MFVNFSGTDSLWQFHGKIIGLDITDNHAPFPSLFIIHEMRVRGFHPFAPVTPDIPTDVLWQDWVISDDIFNNTDGHFIQDNPSADNDTGAPAEPQTQLHPTTTSAPPGRQTLALNTDVITDILAATHAMPSWKACQIEGTSWTGTAEENIEKYMSSIGTQDP